MLISSRYGHRIGAVALARGFRVRGLRWADGLSTGGSAAGFRVRRLWAAAFGYRPDGVSPHPHAAAQMVRGGVDDGAGQARRVGAVLGARTGAALRHGVADGAQAAPPAEGAAGIPTPRPAGD